MNKPVKILLLVVAALLIFAMVGKKKGWWGESEIIEIKIQNAEIKSIIEIVSANGKIQPEIEVKISSDVSGEIVEMLVKEGDEVKVGDLLAKINPDVYASNVDRMDASLNSSRANLANAKARYIEAETIFNRNKNLWQEGVISDADFDGIKASLEVAKQTMVAAEFNIKSSGASLKEAKDNLAKTIIFAPVEGTIYMLGVEKGERVVGTSQMAGTEMMRLANLNEMEVSVEVNENDIVRVEVGDTTNIEVDSYLDREFQGIVTEVANSANTEGIGADQVTNFTVKIRILQSSYSDLIKESNPTVSPFRPGMSATVEIETETVSNVVAVPIQSVTLREDSASNQDYEKKPDNASSKKEECVFIFNEGVASLAWVKTGVQDNDYIEIKEGLESGAKVITGPYSAVSKKLKNESLVKEKEEEKNRE